MIQRHHGRRQVARGGAAGRTISLASIAETVGLSKTSDRFRWVLEYFVSLRAVIGTETPGRLTGTRSFSPSRDEISDVEQGSYQGRESDLAGKSVAYCGNPGVPTAEFHDRLLNSVGARTLRFLEKGSGWLQTEFMTLRRPTDKEISAARKRSQNPYAYIEYLEDDADQPTVVKWANMELSSQNPYASLTPWADRDSVDVGAPWEVSLKTSRRVANQTVLARSVSKDQFRRTAGRIFRQYIPRLEGQKLRNHHRSFIDRNEDRSPEFRYDLLDQLKRYDLSNVAGITPHFNREPVDLTEEKLRAIEAIVLAAH